MNLAIALRSPVEKGSQAVTGSSLLANRSVYWQKTRGLSPGIPLQKSPIITRQSSIKINRI
jgi:hypothetical protein